MAQAVEEAIQALIGIELGMRDQTAGVVERGLEKHLPLAAAAALHPRAEQHIGLPDLIGRSAWYFLCEVARLCPAATGVR